MIDNMIYNLVITLMLSMFDPAITFGSQALDGPRKEARAMVVVVISASTRRWFTDYSDTYNAQQLQL